MDSKIKSTRSEAAVTLLSAGKFHYHCQDVEDSHACVSLQACFKSCNSIITTATAKPQEARAQALSRRQALLLGAGSLAASTFASPLSATADTPAVAAVGIKSAETVQLGQSGLPEKKLLLL